MKEYLYEILSEYLFAFFIAIVLYQHIYFPFRLDILLLIYVFFLVIYTFVKKRTARIFFVLSFAMIPVVILFDIFSLELMIEQMSVLIFYLLCAGLLTSFIYEK